MRQVTSQMSLFIHHIHTEDNLSNKQRPRSIIHRLACLHLQVTVLGRRVYFVYVSWPSYSWQKEKLVQDLRAIANDLDTASLYDHLITLLHVTQHVVQLACRASKYIYSRTSVRRSVGVGMVHVLSAKTITLWCVRVAYSTLQKVNKKKCMGSYQFQSLWEWSCT
jgi:hypothetical protein